MKRKQRTKRSLPMKDFSPAEIRLAQEALKGFEQWLHQSGSNLEKSDFAEEVVLQVKSKLERMRTSLSKLCTFFDYNENLVLFAAIQAHIVSLITSPPTLQRAAQLRRCERIKAFVSLALEAARANPTQD